MTPEQRELYVRLHAIANRHGWSRGSATIHITEGPRTFDVWCTDDVRTIWHWAGTADQIAEALGNWIRERRQMWSSSLKQSASAV
jgi:hypothetical protein